MRLVLCTAFSPNRGDHGSRNSGKGTYIYDEGSVHNVFSRIEATMEAEIGQKKLSQNHHHICLCLGFRIVFEIARISLYCIEVYCNFGRAKEYRSVNQGLCYIEVR